MDEVQQRHLEDHLGDARTFELLEDPTEAIEVLGGNPRRHALGLIFELSELRFGQIEQRIVATAARHDHEIAQVLKVGERELLQIAANSGDRVEGLEGRGGVRCKHGVGQRRDREAIRLTQDRPDFVGGDLSRVRVLGEGDHLVERREGVPNRSLGRARDHGQGVVGDLDRLARGDVAQVRDQVPHADPAKIQPADAREDGREDLVGVRGGEDEGDVLRRLFEGLEQRVEGRGRQHVDLVDDVDLSTRKARQVVDLLAQPTDVVDGVVARAVDLDDVHALAFGHTTALAAGVARLGRRTLLAHERFGQYARGRGLAEPTHPAKEVGVVHPVGLDRVDQGSGDMRLTDDLREALGAVLSREDEVAHGGVRLARGEAPASRADLRRMERRARAPGDRRSNGVAESGVPPAGARLREAVARRRASRPGPRDGGTRPERPSSGAPGGEPRCRGGRRAPLGSFAAPRARAPLGR